MHITCIDGFDLKLKLQILYVFIVHVLIGGWFVGLF
jgi:hypothetical protein